MSKKSGDPGETPEQRAAVDVAKAKTADFRARWAPQQQKLAQAVDAEGAANSAVRQNVTGKANADSAVQFSMAQQKADEAAGATGSLGSAGQKLAITGMGNDQATSRAIGDLNANQSVDEARISGLNTISALGRGEQASAISNMNNVAAMSGRQAQADAEISLQNRMGNAQLAGQALGAGAGLYGANSGTPPPPEDRPADMPYLRLNYRS